MGMVWDIWGMNELEVVMSENRCYLIARRNR